MSGPSFELTCLIHLVPLTFSIFRVEGWPTWVNRFVLIRCKFQELLPRFPVLNYFFYFFLFFVPFSFYTGIFPYELFSLVSLCPRLWFSGFLFFFSVGSVFAWLLSQHKDYLQKWLIIFFFFINFWFLTTYCSLFSCIFFLFKANNLSLVSTKFYKFPWSSTRATLKIFKLYLFGCTRADLIYWSTVISWANPEYVFRVTSLRETFF